MESFFVSSFSVCPLSPPSHPLLSPPKMKERRCGEVNVSWGGFENSIGDGDGDGAQVPLPASLVSPPACGSGDQHAAMRYHSVDIRVAVVGRRDIAVSKGSYVYRELVLGGGVVMLFEVAQVRK